MTDSPADTTNVVPLAGDARWMSDSFVNLVAGLGVPGRDKFASQNYVHVQLTLMELDAAFRSDWIARKIVTIPAWDMTREWRGWQADPDQIELLENLEKKLFIQQKLQEGLIKARLYGGACIIIGVDAGPPEEELNPEMVTQDSLKFLHVISKNQITAGPIIRDISSKYFGQPEYYEARQQPTSSTFKQIPVTTTPEYAKHNVRLHPSRVVKLIGMDTADQMLTDMWGDSVLQPVNDAVKMCGLVTGSLATLVAELKVDVIKVPELKSILSTQAGERKMIARFQAANVAKSVINTILIDGNEEWERIQASLTGVPETMMAYMQIAAGAADIPATRFLGMSPAGLNATGESDIRNYYDRLAAEQTTILTPTMSVLDEVLIRAALGDRPPEVWYEWNSLWQLNATEKAAISLQKAQAYAIDVNAAQLPPVALANARANQLMEDGVYPGLEKALEDAALEGDTIESENMPAPVNPALEAMKTMAENGMVQPPGQPGGPPMPPQPPSNVMPFPKKNPFGKDAAVDDDDLDDFNKCHNESGEEGGEFCEEGSGGESGAGEVGGKGGGGTEKQSKGGVHPEAKKALERGKKGTSLGERIKQAGAALFGKGEKGKATPKAKQEKPAKGEKGAKAEKPKAEKPGEKTSERAAKKAEREKGREEKKTAREEKKTTGEKARAERKAASEKKKTERKSATETKRAERKTASEAKKSARESARKEKQAAGENKAKAPKKEPQGKKEKEAKGKGGEGFKSKTSAPSGGGSGGGGEKGKGQKGGKSETAKAGGGGKAAPKQEAAKAKPKAAEEKKQASAEAKATERKRTEIRNELNKLAREKAQSGGKMSAAEKKEWEQERLRLRRQLLGLDSLVVHYGDADNPQLCDQCGGYHLCSACGGALFDHNECHGPDGKFCSNPSGGPTRSVQRQERAYVRAARSALGGGEGKSWEFPREEKTKGKYESPAEATARGKRNRKREAEAVRGEMERRIGEALRRAQNPKGTTEQAAVEVAVGIGKAARWAYGKLRKSKTAASKPTAAPVKRGRGRPRTRSIGPKRPRGRPRKH